MERLLNYAVGVNAVKVTGLPVSEVGRGQQRVGDRVEKEAKQARSDLEAAMEHGRSRYLAQKQANTEQGLGEPDHSFGQR